MKTFLILVSILHVLALPTINARADSHDFYRGKSVTIIVGNSVGGAMDDWARFIALYLGKHIPGTPTIVVQNMPGAGTIIAANHIFNIAKPDGLTLGLVNPAVYIDQLLRAAEVKFDWPKFSFMGSPERIDQVLFMRADGPYKTLEDIRKAGRGRQRVPCLDAGCSTSHLRLDAGRLGPGVLEGRGWQRRRGAVDGGQRAAPA